MPNIARSENKIECTLTILHNIIVEDISKTI